MWIMLIKKLPTEISPPKLSIHWGIPWRGEIGEAMFKKELIKVFCEQNGRDYYEEMDSFKKSKRDKFKDHLWQEVQEAIAKGDWEPHTIAMSTRWNISKSPTTDNQAGKA